MSDEELSIVPRKEWPAGTYPDGRMYSLEVGRAMRAVMADNDTATDTPAQDENGAFIWVPVDADRSVAPALTPTRGTYPQMASLATRLNARQKQMGQIAWVFYPAEMVKGAHAA